MDELPVHNSIQPMGSWGGVVQYGGGDKSMVVMFYIKGVANPAKSAEVGRPYFDDKVFVRIHPPGERLNIIDREARQDDMRRFPIQYQQFRDNAPQVSDGTPIDMLFASSPATAAALRASGVHTVEQCAELSAHAIETIGMGAQQWVNTAKRYMEVAEKGVKASQLQAIVDKKDREITTLQHQVHLLTEELHEIRDRQAKAVTMDDIQSMIANNGGAQGKRPVFAPGRQLSPAFDAQSAQIAATHATKQISNAKAKKPMRQRARIS